MSRQAYLQPQWPEAANGHLAQETQVYLVVGAQEARAQAWEQTSVVRSPLRL